MGIEVTHLTTLDHEGFGNEVIRYNLDPKNIVLNREIAFCEYLKTADETVWMTEPDTEIYKEFPPTYADCCLLTRRNDGVSLNPAWRLANKRALPLFEELRDEVQKDGRHTWHGDSAAFIEIHKRMGKPMAPQTITYNGVRVELRDYEGYVKGNVVYTRNFLGLSKAKLLNKWGYE